MKLWAVSSAVEQGTHNPLVGGSNPSRPIMTPQEARIVLLEDALRQAQHTVEFLHNCLVNPVDKNRKGFQGYSYGYPDQTIAHLKEWNELVPLVEDSVKPCFHSMIKKDCPSCQEHHRLRLQRFEAKKVLGIKCEYL